MNWDTRYLGSISVALVLVLSAVRDRPMHAEGLPIVAPDTCEVDAKRLASIDSLVAQAIVDRKMPGCVVCIGRHGKIVWLKAYGNRRLEPSVEPMTTDTVFDMASITKPVATATSIMRLIEDGRIALSDKVASLFPDFAAHDKESITLQDLLLHRSGLIPDNALSDYDDGPDRAWERICDLKLIAPVGSAFKYSDVNYLVLGKIVELVSGQKLNDFAANSVFIPLGMRATGFLPDVALQARAAPTEKRNGVWIQGTVHDPRSHALGGVAGHAGLFSTAEDLAIYAQMMLGQGAYRGLDKVPHRILSPASVAAMTRGYAVPGGVRGLGWDKRTSYSINRGDLFSASAFGHGGFTGTVLWIDPELDCFFIFLSNRVHPDGSGSVNSLAGRIANVVASSMTGMASKSSRSSSTVLAGIDVLESDHYRPIAGQRIGLITNHTGRNRAGTSTVRLLRDAPNVQLRALFSPEHGFEGKLDIEKVTDSTDPATGLKIYSLYGENRRPTLEMLEEIDTLVFDIQDIGVRFYTYISTMGEAMKAAAQYRRRFVVLDRPNPINGRDIAGPMLDPDSESFVAFHRLPVRHAMTIGELARMFRDELKLDLDLQVIACQGWQRSDYWDATGLTWINPSPNMRSLTQALLYPGIGLLEVTNLSVGRGTDTPFEVIGAPWMQARDVARQMNQLQLDGVAFIPVEFTPSSSKYANEMCNGINIQITNREKFEPVRVGLAIAATLHRLHREQWQTQNLNRLLGNQGTLATILEPQHSEAREAAITEGIGEFLRRREAFLLY